MNVEFELRLKDMMSGMLPHVEAAARRAFEGVDNSIRGSQRHFDNLGRSVESVNEKMTMLKTTSAMFFGSLAERGLERGFDFLKEQVKGVLDMGMEGRKVEMMMKVQMGDEQGAKLHEQLEDNLKHSLYGTSTYAQGRGLVSAGETRAQVMTDIKQMEDIAAGDKGNMQAIVDVMRRIKMKESLTLREMMPLTDAGFNPALILAKAHGGTQGQWMERLEDQTKALGLFREAMTLATEKGGMFYKMQEKILGTPWGKQTLLATNVDLAKEQLGKHPVIEAAEIRFFDKLNTILTKLSAPENMDKMAAAIGGMIDKATEFANWAASHTDDIGRWMHEVKVGIEALLAIKVAKLGAGGLMNVGEAGMEAFETARRVVGIAGKMHGMLAGEGAVSAGMIGEGAAAGLGGSALFAGAAIVGGGLLVKLMQVDLQAISNALHPSAEEKKHQDRVWAGFAPGPGRFKEPAGSHMKKPAESQFTAKEQAEIDKVMGKHYATDNDKNNAYWKEVELIKKKRLAEENGTAAKGGSAASDASDAIVGGGQKRVTINYNAPLYKVEHQTFQNIKDAINDFEPKIKEAMLRIFYSVPGMQ